MVDGQEGLGLAFKALAGASQNGEMKGGRTGQKVGRQGPRGLIVPAISRPVSEYSEDTPHSLCSPRPAIGLMRGRCSYHGCEQMGEEPGCPPRGQQGTRRVPQPVLPALGHMAAEGPQPSPGARFLPLSVPRPLGAPTAALTGPGAWVPSVLASKCHVLRGQRGVLPTTEV